MRFLADESCDFAVIRALRGAGHDVSSIAEQARGTPDSEVIARAVAEDRVLITEDTDFGELVYANARAARGVMLLRFPERTRAGMAQAVLEFVSSGPGRVLETFVVIQPGRVRMTHLPNREA